MNQLAWLGEVPKRWRVVKLRQILRPFSEKNHPELPLLSVVREKGVIVRNVADKEENHNYVPEDLSGYKRVKRGQFAMNKMKAWQGSYGVSKYDGIVSPAYFVFDIDYDIDHDFFNVAIRSKAYVSYFGQASDGIRVGQWDLSMQRMKEIPFLVPPRDEQEQIVRFLDWKVSAINRLINNNRKILNCLDELKQSIISHLITKGIGKIHTKSTEIYWLKEIPNAWKETKLKYILCKQQRPVLPNADLLICSNSGEVRIRGDEKIGLVASSNDIYQGVAKGDLLIHGMDTWHGAIAISDFDGMCTPVVHVCTCSQSKRFVAYYLKMMAYTKVFKAISNGVRQNTSDFRSWNKVGELMIAFPAFDVQEKIADIIDKTIKNIAICKEQINVKISTLTELKARLISDVVTGKIDVRGVEVPEFAPVEEEVGTDMNEEEVGEEID